MLYNPGVKQGTEELGKWSRDSTLIRMDLFAKRTGPWHPYPFMPIHQGPAGFYYHVEFPLRWSAGEFTSQIVLVTVEGDLGKVFPCGRYQRGNAKGGIYERQGS